jgi:DNA-binding NarL/FixJ family response regulator
MRPATAVISEIPALRRGLAASLRQLRFTVHEHARWPVDIDLAPSPAIVWTCEHSSEVARVRGRARPDRDLRLVVLLRHPTTAGVADALCSGAAAVAGWDVDGPALAALVECADNCLVAVPRELAVGLAESADVQPPVGLSEDDRTLLSYLCRGGPVSHLAPRLGYSERETYRRLGDLYRRIGAANRTAAVVAATRWGIG